MKTKNIILSGFVLIAFTLSKDSFGQLKVQSSNGNVGVGTLTPASKLHVVGDAAMFSNPAASPTTCASIRCNSNYSTATTPEYTWYGDDQTGIFHPASHEIALSVNGAIKTRLVDNAIYFPYSTAYPTSSAFIKLTDSYGTAGSPEYTWYNDGNTGIYHPAIGQIGITIGGATKMKIGSNAVYFPTSSTTPTSAAYIKTTDSYGTASGPEYTWYNDNTTGLYHPAVNEIGFSIGGSTKMKLVNNAVYFPTSSITPTSSAFIKLTDSYGTASAPEYTWYGDNTTGLYHPAASEIGISIGGSTKVKLVSNAIYFPTSSTAPTSAALIRLLDSYGTATTPEYTWFGNDQTGIFHPGSNVIAFTTAGSETMRLTSDAKLALGTTSPGTYKFYVSGSAFATGVWSSSDKRFKKNVEGISGALEKVLKLNGKIYEFKTDEFKNMNFDAGKNYGFIAQELKEVLPEAVKENADGYLAVNYNMIIPVLTEAIKEQNTVIKKQEEQINALEEAVKNTAGSKTPTGVTLSESSALVGQAKLFQNNPNPFSTNTEIKCFVPQDSQTAMLYLFDMQGTQIRTVRITEKGDASVMIKAESMKPGMYLYSLIVDGKEIDTKRMILTN